MRPKQVLKIIIDVFMTIALFLLMGYQFWGEAAHEWIGAALFALFILHHVLNRKWYYALPKGRYGSVRIFQTVIDFVVLLSMLSLMYSGIVLSRYAFSFLPIDSGLALARKLHVIGSYWGFLLMGVHLGLHWDIFISIAKRKWKIKEPSMIHSVLLFLIGLLIALYGVAVFIKRNFLVYLFLINEFVFLDYEESVVLFYFDYFALMGLCVFASHYLSKLLRMIHRRKELSE